MREVIESVQRKWFARNRNMVSVAIIRLLLSIEELHREHPYTLQEVLKTLDQVITEAEEAKRLLIEEAAERGIS